MWRINRRAPLLAVVVVAAALGMGGGRAYAQSGDRGSADALETARVHFDRAEGLFASGRFDAAVVEYQAAYAAAPLPKNRVLPKFASPPSIVK